MPIPNPKPEFLAAYSHSLLTLESIANLLEAEHNAGHQDPMAPGRLSEALDSALNVVLLLAVSCRKTTDAVNHDLALRGEMSKVMNLVIANKLQGV